MLTAILCGSLPAISNGRYTIMNSSLAINERNQWMFGSTATYSCKIGFKITGGNKTRTCIEDQENTNYRTGVWSGTAPNCTGECINNQ